MTKRKTTKRRRNPRGKHLAGATAAMNRQYEAILKSERKRGVPLKEAKRIAAATARARAKATNPKRQRNKAAHISEADISKFPPNIQKQLRAQLGKVEEKERKAASAKATPAQKKAAVKAKRSFLSRLGTRLRVIGQTKTRKVQARDLGRCKRRVVKVRARHETDALAKAASKLGSGYDQLKVVNATRKRGRCNPSYTVEATPKYTKTITEDVKALTRGSAIRQVRRKVPGPKNIYSYSVTKNPRKRRRRNESVSPKELRREFAGRVGPGADLYFPEHTPHGLAKLGKLVSIETEEGTIKPVHGSAWLCADKRGRLHIGSVSGMDVYSGPRRSFGHVKRIEYDESKPHLGYKSPIIWTHKMAEGGGVRPRLYADGEGGLVFKGGSYRIEREGIVG